MVQLSVKRILVLGSSGMLGHAITRVFNEDGFEVVEANRAGIPIISRNIIIKFDVLRDSLESIFDQDQTYDYCVNAIGIIRHLINESNEGSILETIRVNRDLPAKLSILAASSGLKVIQIATDCVFSGNEGYYTESSLHSPTDFYGSSKSVGEENSPEIMHIRSSIIGHELLSSNSLMDWFLKQPENAVVNGYTNHFWNGLTTLHFGRVISGIINSNNFLKGTFHLIPKDICSKYELLQLFARHFGRPDLTVQAHTSLVSINRTLDTVFSEKNLRFWKDAGYNCPLSIAEMLSEYADWESDKILASRQK